MNNFNNPFKGIYPRNPVPPPGPGPVDYVRAIDDKIRTVEPIGEYIPVRFYELIKGAGTTNYMLFQFGEMKFGVINYVVLDDIFQNPAVPVIFRVNGRSYPFNIPSDKFQIEMNIPLISNSTIEITWSPVGGVPQTHLTYDIRGYYYNK